MSTDHISNIMSALEDYRGLNNRSAVDEPANEFEMAINEHYELQGLLETLKAAMKPLEAEEMQKRKAIAESLRMFFKTNLKEGMNTYNLSNNRKVKFDNKITRKIDAEMVRKAGLAYADAEDAPANVDFDDLLKLDYKLVAAPFKKIAPGGDASKAVARMLITTDASPVIKVV